MYTLFCTCRQHTIICLAQFIPGRQNHHLEMVIQVLPMTESHIVLAVICARTICRSQLVVFGEVSTALRSATPTRKTVNVRGCQSSLQRSLSMIQHDIDSTMSKQNLDFLWYDSVCLPRDRRSLLCCSASRSFSTQRLFPGARQTHEDSSELRQTDLNTRQHRGTGVQCTYLHSGQQGYLIFGKHHAASAPRHNGMGASQSCASIYVYITR